jgi:hypothetical protein
VRPTQAWLAPHVQDAPLLSSALPGTTGARTRSFSMTLETYRRMPQGCSGSITGEHNGLLHHGLANPLADSHVGVCTGVSFPHMAFQDMCCHVLLESHAAPTALGGMVGAHP